MLTVWLWESLENLPMILGFVIAARLWEDTIPAGLVALTVGMGLGVLVTRLVEPRLHKANHEVPWLSVLANFTLFTALAVPFLYYFRSNARWINWKIDLLGGLVAGLVMTLVQSLHWTGAKSRMLLHGVAMLSAFPVVMVLLRAVIRLESWGLTVFYTLLLTLFASLVIALIDYQEMYRNTIKR